MSAQIGSRSRRSGFPYGVDRMEREGSGEEGVVVRHAIISQPGLGNVWVASIAVLS